jgi:ferritin-like metal-binding protein YciE
MVMYTGLIQMAKDLGERDAAQLLQENLDQEKAMAKRVEALSKELSKQAKGQEAGREKESELVGARSGRK